MDTNWVSALSGVLGSLVGGSATVATAWLAQKTVSRRELLRDEIGKREALYGEFIGECAKRLVDAFEHELENPAKLLPVYAAIARIRLSASKPVLVEAELLLRRITEQYFSTQLTVEEVRHLIAEDPDPLKAFGEACRAELNSMRGSV